MSDQDQLRREFLRVIEMLYDARPWAELARIQREFDDKLRKHWRDHYPRRIFPDHKLGEVYRDLVTLVPELAADRASAEAEARKVREKYRADDEFFSGWLTEIADQCEIRTSRTSWTTIKTIGTSSYNSTGSAHQYAQGKAQLLCELLQRIGLKTRIETFEPTANMRDYIVQANVTESEKEIVLRMSLSSLRDEVKWYRQHGLNPRVYHAGLPHDFEARVGLDSQGNDVPPRGA